MVNKTKQNKNTIIFYFFRKDLKFFPIYGKPLHMSTTTEFSYHYRSQKSQTLSQPPWLLVCGHRLPNHLYPLQTLKLIDKEAWKIGNSFMCRQSYIYFLWVAVAIAPSNSVVSSISGLAMQSIVSVSSDNNSHIFTGPILKFYFGH